MMIGLGLSIAGAAALQQMGPVFRTSLSSGLLRPHRDWAGIPNSGFTVTPTDPVRTTAKPILRLVTAPMVTVTDETVVGAMAVANDGGTLIGGIDRVRFHFEGSVMDVFAPTFRTFTRRDGSTYQQIGYWVTLQKPAGTEGVAQLYVEAIPTDATMQRRVIGPYRYFLYDAEFTHQVTLNPALPVVTGSNYQDIGAALNYLRSQNALRSRITGYGSTHVLGAAAQTAFTYTTGQATVLEWNEPVVISQDTANKGGLRLRHSNFIIRGDNITFDVLNISEFLAPDGGVPMQFDRVAFTNSGGRFSLWNKGTRPIARMFQEALTGEAQGGPWITDCAFDNTSDSGMQGPNLNRGSTFDNITKDGFNKTLCWMNTITRNLDSVGLRNEVDAMTVTGPAGATLSLAGVNETTPRTFTAREAGVSVGTFVVRRNNDDFLAGTNYDVADVVAWINTLPGWTATLLDDTRRASALGLPDSTGDAFTNLDVSTTKTLVTQFAVHTDYWQGTGDLENALAMNNVGLDLVAQHLLITRYVYKDVAFINTITSANFEIMDGSFSQMGGVHSHVILAHNSIPDQGLWMRRDTVGSLIGLVADSYSLVANNIWRSGSNVAGGPTDETVKNNHYLEGNVMSGETGGTVGGTRETIVANIEAGDFTPAGELLTNLKPAVWPWDAYGKSRATDAPAGAVA